MFLGNIYMHYGIRNVSTIYVPFPPIEITHSFSGVWTSKRIAKIKKIPPTIYYSQQSIYYTKYTDYYIPTSHSSQPNSNLVNPHAFSLRSHTHPVKRNAYTISTNIYHNTAIDTQPNVTAFDDPECYAYDAARFIAMFIARSLENIGPQLWSRRRDRNPMGVYLYRKCT